MKNTKILIVTSEINAVLSSKSLSGIRISSESYSCGEITRIPVLNPSNNSKNITQKSNR